jgi:flagellar hook-length control protein FliK
MPKGIQFPSTEKALSTQVRQSANGSITEAFVAGPNQPWKSQWVFGAQAPTQTPAEPIAGSKELAQMKELVSQKGGNEKQVQQAGSQALAQMNSQMNEMLAQMQGGVVSTSTSGIDKNADIQSGDRPSVISGLSGNEFLDALQGVKKESSGGQMGSQTMMGQNDQQGFAEMMQTVSPQKGKTATVNGKPEFQLIQGGLSSGNELSAPMKNKLSSSGAAGMSEAGMGATVHQLMQPQVKVGPPPQPVITGHVVPGAMARERLTRESIGNMGSSISSMTASGGGQMKIRLNPGNLGELTIRVSTDGKRVGLQVQATDEGAKKILEESMSSLKENLASQNLSLTAVSVSIASPSQQSAFNSDQSHQQLNQYSQNQSGSFGSPSGQSQNSEQGGNGPASERVYSTQNGTPASRTHRSPSSNGAGRLDVTA